MSENIKTNVEEVEETMEETKDGVLTKVGGFTKKNGKKIAVGIAVVVGFGVAYILGQKSVVAFSTDVVDDAVDAVADIADEVTNL